jgi:hypothetical protein
VSQPPRRGSPRAFLVGSSAVSRPSGCWADGSLECRYCCKSPKLPGANFPAARQSDPPPSIDIATIALPRSPVSISSGDEVPQIFTRKSRLQPREFLITSAKELLQQNLPIADSCTAQECVQSRLMFRRFSDAVATKREDRHSPTRHPAVLPRRSDLEPPLPVI